MNETTEAYPNDFDPDVAAEDGRRVLVELERLSEELNATPSHFTDDALVRILSLARTIESLVAAELNWRR